MNVVLDLARGYLPRRSDRSGLHCGDEIDAEYPADALLAAPIGAAFIAADITNNNASANTIALAAPIGAAFIAARSGPHAA